MRRVFLRILIRHSHAHEGHKALAEVDYQGDAVEIRVPHKQCIDG